MPKFGCHGNSLGSLGILDSIFEIADPENPTIHAQFLSVSCTEMKFCLFECLAYLYHCGYRQFSRFLRKIVEIVKKNLIKPIKGTRIHGNTSYEPLTTFLRRTMRSVQVSKNVKKEKKVKKIDTGVTISPIWGRVPSKRTKTKFGMRGRVADVIICFKFYRNRLRGFRAVRGQKWGSSIDFDRRPYNRSALPCCL